MRRTFHELVHERRRPAKTGSLTSQLDFPIVAIGYSSIGSQFYPRNGTIRERDYVDGLKSSFATEMVTGRHGVARINLLSSLLATICAASFSGQAFAIDARPKVDEGVVLVRAIGGTVRTLEYWQFSRKDGFTVTARGAMHPVIVKAGHYYLHSITQLYANVSPINRKEPASEVETLDVQAGAVTYIGDIEVKEIRGRSEGLSWTFNVNYSPATLLEAKHSYPWLAELPLFVADQSGKPLLSVSWSTENAASSD